MTVMRAIWT